jgi:hypothetical protein
MENVFGMKCVENRQILRDFHAKKKTGAPWYCIIDDTGREFSTERLPCTINRIGKKKEF